MAIETSVNPARVVRVFLQRILFRVVGLQRPVRERCGASETRRCNAMVDDDVLLW